jgi:hypothetical protein
MATLVQISPLFVERYRLRDADTITPPPGVVQIDPMLFVSEAFTTIFSQVVPSSVDRITRQESSPAKTVPF